MKKYHYYIVIIAIIIALGQIAFLASMIKSRNDLLTDGREIVLDIKPVDPRDFMRGDYVVLSYGLLSPIWGLKVETHDIYVLLRQNADQKWVYVSHQSEPFINLAINEVQLHGQKDGYRYKFGIEHFYVPDGAGKAIEQDLQGINNKNYSVVVAVSPDGTAVIKSLRYLGKDLF